MRFLLQLSIVIFAMHLVPQTATAQIVNTWRGGTPGQETNWACSKNWSLSRVPDAFHNVIIPNVSTGSGKFPVIQSGMIELNQLDIHPCATLTVRENVRLLVNVLHCYGTCVGCSRGVWIEGEELVTVKCSR